MLYYIWDALNHLIGFKKDGKIYFYEKNNQEDIIGIYNEKHQKIATYEYDSFGKLLSIKDEQEEEIIDKTNIAYLNSYRYRSYYYDEETKLYYLNTRYYNPAWGRFLNADGIIGTNETNLGYNLYAYCENNPINRTDKDGNFALLAGMGAALVGLGCVLLGAIAATPAVRNATYKVTRTVVNTMVDSMTKVKDLVQIKSNDTSWNVYTLVNPNIKVNGKDKVEYVGRTKDLNLRAQQHKNNPFRKGLIMVTEDEHKNLYYERARGIEQALIKKYDTLNRGNYRNNQINGIAFNNKFRLDYIAAAADYFGEETYVGGIKW